MPYSSEQITDKIERNLFILTSPFQLFVAESMISSIPDDFRHTENILIFEKQYNLSYSRDCWSSAYRLADTGYGSIGIRKKQAAKQNLKLVLDLCAPLPKATRIFFANMHYSMINLIFFDNNVRRCCRFSLIMDGMASYVEMKITPVRHLRDLVKFVAGFMGLGIKFYPYLTNYLGDHFEIVESVYGFQSQYLSCDQNKRKEIPLITSNTFLPEPNSCLFLDQTSFINVLGYRCWKQMLITAVNYITSSKYEVLYFKSHPNTHLSLADREFLEQNGFKIIETNECIETLLPSLNPAAVISFTSTSLFMLKCIYGDQLKCISLFNHAKNIFSSSIVYDRIITLFKDVNVELI